MDSSIATINSTLQSIHAQCNYLAKVELWKPRPNYKTPTKSIKLLTHLIKAGPTLTDIQTIREVIKKAYRWPFNRYSHFPIKFPTFQFLPQIILLTNQLYEKRTTSSGSIALLSAHAIGAVDELISTIKYIAVTGEFRKISKIFQEKLETKGAALNKRSRGILSLYQPIHDLQSILSCNHHSAIREFFTRFHQLTSEIDIDHYSILPPQLGARLLRLLVLIIVHQEYISPAKEIITLRAFTIQEELQTNPITRNIYRTKYTEEIIRRDNQSVIIHRLTLQQKNKINSILIGQCFTRPDTFPYQLSPLTLKIKTKEAEQRDKVKVTDNSTDEAERKNQEEELKTETKAKLEKTEKKETKGRKEEIKKETWLEPTHPQTTDQQGDLPLETAATETAEEETTKMRQADGQQPEGVHESHDHQTHQRATTMNSTTNICRLVTQLRASNPQATIIIFLP